MLSRYARGIQTGLAQFVYPANDLDCIRIWYRHIDHDITECSRVVSARRGITRRADNYS